MQKHCWCLVTSIAGCISQLQKDSKTTGCSGFPSNSSVCGFFLFILCLVVIVCSWQVKGTLTFAACVYERLGFLLSGTCKRSVVILSQGEVGSDAFPQAIAEARVIHCCQGAFGIFSHFQPLREQKFVTISAAWTEPLGIILTVVKPNNVIFVA